MKNSCEIKVTSELLKNTTVNDEHLYRDLARKMVSEMPMDELHKLIDLSKIDPDSDESKRMLLEVIDNSKIGQIQQLKDQKLILYSAKVNLP